jgi:hypothetical protein
MTTATELLKKQANDDLWNVTVYVASFTKVQLAKGHTPRILDTLAKLRDEIADLERIDE